MTSHFSEKIQNLQIAWDSTTISAFKRCPRYYQLSFIENWQPKGGTVALEFGIYFHSLTELFEKLIAQGLSYEDALKEVIRKFFVIKAVWNPSDPLRNAKSLLITVFFYIENWRLSKIKTFYLKNGQPAVELSFRLALGKPYLLTDEEVIICGHMDRLVTIDDSIYVADKKTTGHGITRFFYLNYLLNDQVTLYYIAAQIVLAVPAKGILIDAASIDGKIGKFDRQIVHRSIALAEEWLEDLTYWLRYAETCAKAQHWPKNENSCSMYGGCVFRSVCTQTKKCAPKILNRDFEKREQWNPLKER